MEKKRLAGTVVNFLKLKGYGFIRQEYGEKVFVHFSDIRGKEFRTLVPGEEVEFSLRDGERGLQAVDVLRLNPPDTDDDLPEPMNRTW